MNTCKVTLFCLDFTHSMTCFQVRRGRRELEAAARAREESVMDLEVKLSNKNQKLHWYYINYTL